MAYGRSSYRRRRRGNVRGTLTGARRSKRSPVVKSPYKRRAGRSGRLRRRARSHRMGYGRR